MKVWLLFMASIFFLLCINQHAFAGCTNPDDGNGSACQASGNCSKPCGAFAPFLGTIQAGQPAIPFRKKPSTSTPSSMVKTPHAQSHSFSVVSLSFAILICGTIILRKVQTSKSSATSTSPQGQA